MFFPKPAKSYIPDTERQGMKNKKTDAFRRRLLFLFEKNYCNLQVYSIIIY